MSNSIPLAKDKTDLSNLINDAMNSKAIAEENSFPIQAFPIPFRDLITDLNKSLNFNIDYTGTAILTAVATALGTTAKVEVKNGWNEYGSIYTCLIGNSGANKTHPVKKIFEVIRNIDKTNHDSFAELQNEYSSYSKLPKKIKETRPIKAKPRLTKSILDNFTPEILNKRLSENLRGCTVVSDELDNFLCGMNNYSKSDQIGVFLSLWSNQPTTIDRMSEPIPLLLNNPYLCIIGGLQPRLLGKSFSIQKLDNGFFQRFLHAYPETTLKSPINDNQFNIDYLIKYNEFIKNLILKSPIKEVDGNVDSRVLTWTPEAKSFFYNWQSNNCDLVNEHQKSIISEIASKYDNHFVRIALLLQIMEDPESTSIGILAVQGAKDLCTYFFKCALKVLKKIQNPFDYLQTITENKKQFYNAIELNFSTSKAVTLGLNFDLKERLVKDFLNDTILFKKIKHGEYQKMIATKKQN